MFVVSSSTYSIAKQSSINTNSRKQTNQNIVNTVSGKVEGFQTENGVYAFLGIPYAEAPKGDLRFAAPVEKKPWKTTLQAKQFGFSCPQTNDKSEPASLLPQDEDCLTLNIWTPMADNKKRPVIIYIHGGGFINGGSGDPTYNGSTFSKRGNIVFASINYRINAFGGLYLEDFGEQYRGSGSTGIQDQIMAMKWIKNNIAKFGGDPENITIMGESAGCISSITLMSLPQTKGLFKKVIAESGGCNVLRTREQASQFTKQFLEIAGVNDVASLKKLTKEQVVDIAAKQLAAAGVVADMVFAPVIDETVIPEYPPTAIENGAAKGIALLNGTNHDEYRYWLYYIPSLVSTSLDQLLGMAPELKAKLKGQENKILDFYQKKYQGMEKGNETLAFVTDLVFYIPHTQICEAQSKYSNVWLYRFDWKSHAQEYFGACHAIELPFVFKTFDSPLSDEIVGPTPPIELSDIMQDAWISFARTGNPNHKGMPEWPRYDTERRATMIFNTTSELKDDPDKEVRELYKGITY
jgi:para-nitrobenzyl esterase